MWHESFMPTASRSGLRPPTWLFGGPEAGAPACWHRWLRPAVARPAALIDHERGGCRNIAGSADVACRSLLLRDDAPLRRSRWRAVPRGGRAARTALVGSVLVAA